MKRLFLLVCLLVSAARAGEPAAPALTVLEKKLTTELDAQKNGSVNAEQHRLFLKEFRPELEKTFAATPPSSGNETAHARILVLLGDRQQAAENLQGALKMTPNDPTLRVTLGRTRLADNDYAGALAEANSVLEKDPNNADAKALKYESQGRGSPTKVGQRSAGAQTGQATQPVTTRNRPAVATTETPKRGPLSRPVPATETEQPEPKSGKSPLWPWTLPLSGALIGYGYWHGKKSDGDVCTDSNEPTPEQVARSEKIAKTVKAAGTVLAAGLVIAAVGPYVLAGAAAYFTGLGPPAAGTLALAGGGTLGGAAALSPAVVTAGANALGATTIVVGEVKVASDYYSNSKGDSNRGTDAGKVKQKKGDFLEKLERTKPKTNRSRWIDEKGRIYEWDSQHGELEVYNGRGQHIGVRDPETGEWIKPAKPGRGTEP